MEVVWGHNVQWQNNKLATRCGFHSAWHRSSIAGSVPDTFADTNPYTYADSHTNPYTNPHTRSITNSRIVSCNFTSGN